MENNDNSEIKIKIAEKILIDFENKYFHLHWHAGRIKKDRENKKVDKEIKKIFDASAKY